MHATLYILADTDIPIRGIVIVVGLIIWGISAMAKQLKTASGQQRERMRQVREAIERSQAQAQQRPYQPAPPPQLAPEIARRTPAYRPKPPKQRPPARRPTDYNAMAQRPARAAAPPPLKPVRAKLVEEVPTLEALPEPSETPTATPRKAATVNARAIKAWLKPQTLRQQFILTEVFQGPLALRQER